MYTFLNGVGKAYRAANMGASSVFKPTDLTGLTLWLDAADTTTITQTGGNVSQWDDKSGNGYHLTQAIGGSQPVSGTRTLNSLNVLDFSQDYLQNTSDIANIFTGTETWFVVNVADDTVIGNMMYVCNSGSEDGGGLYNGAGATSILEVALTRENKRADFFYQDGTSAVLPRPVNSYTADTQIDFVTYAPSSSLIVGNNNGETDTGGTVPASGTYTPTRFRIGAHGTASSRTERWFNGAVGEVLIFSRVLSNAEINQIGTYLADKWGMTWTDI